MDIKVTNGTNTCEEKVEMIKLGVAVLKNVIGNTLEASYIVIHNAVANSWGYDGQTQCARVQQAMAA